MQNLTRKIWTVSNYALRKQPVFIPGIIGKTLCGQTDRWVGDLLCDLYETIDSHKINFSKIEMKAKLFLWIM